MNTGKNFNTGNVSGIEVLSGGVVRLKVSEAEVNEIKLRFFDRNTLKPTQGNTRPETILHRLKTKKGENSISSGALVHGNVPHNRRNPTFEFLTAGLDISRRFQPNWRGMAGVILQRAGARDEFGRYLTEDCYGSPLTASGNTHDHMLVSKLEAEYYDFGTHGPSNILFNMEQGLPIMPSWLCFNKVNARARKEIELGFARLVLSLTGGHLVGSFPAHKAFAIGGTDSVRGYEEGAVGSGRSFVVGSAEVPIPIVKTLEGVISADYGSDLGSGPMVPDDPAGTRLKPGNGYGYGTGVHWHSPLGLLRFEYAFNGKDAGRFHFGIGKRI
ncbi:hypothetical protein IFM89_007002 [Coptis chinensis]|uniref:Bacterial surface antigen (D15) domain-containing protein n=1 Tax=Coptis chinensis TaxID=261450 RepID=A0A835INE9_9MAGN|nr:hypothetical protein IFM89_007002 [Coptis chinensis]